MNPKQNNGTEYLRIFLWTGMYIKWITHKKAHAALTVLQLEFTQLVLVGYKWFVSLIWMMCTSAQRPPVRWVCCCRDSRWTETEITKLNQGCLTNS